MTWFFGNRKSLIVSLALVFTLALGLRLFDLTDLPLDFSPTRQLFSALKARGIYYASLPENTTAIPAWERESAINQWKSMQAIEPTVIENLAAFTYRFTGEQLWVARAYSSLFWVLAGIPLFLLAQEIAGTSGAFIALLFYLFLPYGVLSSRTFQPDPLMVALVSSASWANFRWANTLQQDQKTSWKWTITAGILNGLALFVKNVSVFPLAFSLAGLILERGIIPSIKDRKTWALAGLTILPSALYTIYGLLIAGFLGQQFAFRFFPQLWPDPAFYLRWKNQIDGVTGFGALAAGIIGVFLSRRRVMAFLTGLWLGYFAFGMTFAYHITTHDYYQMVLILIVAISLAPIAQTIFAAIEKQHAGLTLLANRVILSLLLFLVVLIQVWNVRVELVREDWRPESVFWSDLGKKLGQNGPILTISQDYGYRLAYWGWQQVDAWYDAGDLALRSLDGRQINLLQRFQDQAAGKKYLVVTQSGKLDQQPEIKNYIYKTYPIFAEGKGYVIFDLSKHK